MFIDFLLVVHPYRLSLDFQFQSSAQQMIQLWAQKKEEELQICETQNSENSGATNGRASGRWHSFGTAAKTRMVWHRKMYDDKEEKSFIHAVEGWMEKESGKVRRRDETQFKDSFLTWNIFDVGVPTTNDTMEEIWEAKSEKSSFENYMKIWCGTKSRLGSDYVLLCVLSESA